MACTACLVCFISTVNGRSNKKRKEKKKLAPGKAGASSGHITNLKQSILETFDIYGQHGQLKGTTRQGQEHRTVVQLCTCT